MVVKNRTLVVMSGINPRLGHFEVLGIAERLGHPVRREGKLVFVRGNWENYTRLAYAKYVGRYLFSYRRASLYNTRDLDREVKGRAFYVVGERGLGWWIEGRVNPKGVRVLSYRYRGRSYVLYPFIHITDRDFRERDAVNRPFFHPSSLNARDARMLVNLAGVMKGETVLDPFCGAGGILIEAGLIGARVIGIELDGEMARGCIQNLQYYGVRGEVIHGDAREEMAEADVIVTDPPYGRSTKVRGKLLDLYLRVFSEGSSLAERMVVMLPFEGEWLLEKAGWDVVRSGRIRVHKSLTRRVYVCRS